MFPPPPRSTLFPYTTLFRSKDAVPFDVDGAELGHVDGRCSFESILLKYGLDDPALGRLARIVHGADIEADVAQTPEDRKSTRLNSSHVAISYAVFCLKKKKK